MIDNSNQYGVSLDNRPVNSCKTSKVSRGKREQG